MVDLRPPEWTLGYAGRKTRRADNNPSVARREAALRESATVNCLTHPAFGDQSPGVVCSQVSRRQGGLNERDADEPSPNACVLN